MAEITDITKKIKKLNIEMCKDFVIVEPLLEEADTSSIVLPEGIKHPDEPPKQQSRVIARGPDCVNPKIKDGSIIIHNLMLFRGGVMFVFDDIAYIVLREQDIYGIM